MKQYEAVILAMRENGGYATLGHLYRTVLKIPDCHWGTQTPFASIRRIVQTYPNIFFKIKPGLWGLVAEKKHVLKQLSLDGKPTEARVEHFNHSYYQGLLIEIGNLRRYKTFVPHQDKNKSFQSRRLSEVSTLKDFPEFTHDYLLKRARTVDVAWFNERGLPYAFFEVEHSTDIRNSLQKFVEFQDFRIKFRIVADSVRRQDFESKIASHIFAPIRSTVRFIDYDKLFEWHNKISEIVALEETFDL